MTQLTTKRAAALAKGDIITRYPYNGAPQTSFDKAHTILIEVYEVRSINSSKKIVELVTARNDSMMIAMPAEVSRIFIHQQHLVTQQIWWIDDNAKLAFDLHPEQPGSM